MTKNKWFDELKEAFRRELLFPHQRTQGFHALLRQTRFRADKPRRRLTPHELDELHAIYKDHKLSILKEIMDCCTKDDPPYPLQVMNKAISDEATLRGVNRITEDQFRRIYIAVMDVEKGNKDEVQGKITSAARNELEKILSQGSGN